MYVLTTPGPKHENHRHVYGIFKVDCRIYVDLCSYSDPARRLYGPLIDKRSKRNDTGGSARTSWQFERKCRTSAYASCYQVFLTSIEQLTNRFLGRPKCGIFTLTPPQTDCYEIYIVKSWIRSDFGLPRRLHDLCELFDQQDN